jgi:hypothetical protein
MIFGTYCAIDRSNALGPYSGYIYIVAKYEVGYGNFMDSS